MKITLSDAQVEVVLSALEAFSRFHINQPKTALEHIFPKKCWDLGWDEMQELVLPLQKTFFPDYPSNGGPGICNPEIGKEPQIAYEITKQIEQYRALQKSNGWFGSTVDFSGADLNPSGEPPPKIEGLEEMQYKDFYISDQNLENIKQLYDNNEYEEIWKFVNKTMYLPMGDSKEIIENSYGFSSVRRFYIRVYKPRKPLDGEKF